MKVKGREEDGKEGKDRRRNEGKGWATEAKD